VDADADAGGGVVVQEYGDFCTVYVVVISNDNGVRSTVRRTSSWAGARTYDARDARTVVSLGY